MTGCVFLMRITGTAGAFLRCMVRLLCQQDTEFHTWRRSDNRRRRVSYLSFQITPDSNCPHKFGVWAE